MIEIFKTNVQEVGEAKTIIEELLKHFPSSRINFALDDCDKILRAEGTEICPNKVIELLKRKGFLAEVLNCFVFKKQNKWQNKKITSAAK